MEVEDQLTALLEAGNYEEFERVSAEADARLAARREKLTAPGALASTAMWYASNGIPIFPLMPGAKTPATTNGFHNATTDTVKVELWWSHRRYNIGMPTGLRWNVLDVDGPAGFHSLGLLRENGALPPIVGRVWTPGDRRKGRGPGLHLYTPATEGVINAAGIAPGIDVRGLGGYVVVPPSVIDGRHYEWGEMVSLD
jgi:hypothetical protein